MGRPSTCDTCGTTDFPTVTITCVSPSVTNGGNTTAIDHTFTFTLSEAAGNGTLFESGDVVVEKGALGSLTQNGLVFTGTLTVSNTDVDGEVSVSVPRGRFRDEDGNDNRSSLFTMHYNEGNPPTVTITSEGTPSVLDGGSTYDITIELTFTLSEAAGHETVFDVDDVSVTNGIKGALSTVTDTQYRIPITATKRAISTSVSVPAGGFKDDDGNENLESNTFDWIYHPDPENPCPECPDPSDCPGAVAVVFIDETDKAITINNIDYDEAINELLKIYLKAFPDRLLIIMDVQPGGWDPLPYENWPQFEASDRCYSLRLEHAAGLSSSIPEYIKRDGSVAADGSDTDHVFSYITAIVNNTSNDEVINIWKNASEISIFRDISGSLPIEGINSPSKAYDQFEADAVVGDAVAGIGPKTIVSSIMNNLENFICPFSFQECCENQSSADLIDLCREVTGILTYARCYPTKLKFKIEPGYNAMYAVDNPCESYYCVENVEPEPRSSLVEVATEYDDCGCAKSNDEEDSSGFGFSLMQTIYPTSKETFEATSFAEMGEIGSQSFGSDIAMSANGDTIVVVEHKPVRVNVKAFGKGSVESGSVESGGSTFTVSWNEGPSFSNLTDWTVRSVPGGETTLSINHHFIDGDLVYYAVEPDADGLPQTPLDNLTHGVIYRVKDVTDKTFRLSKLNEETSATAVSHWANYNHGVNPAIDIVITLDDKSTAFIHKLSLVGSTISTNVERLRSTKICTYKRVRTKSGCDANGCCTDYGFYYSLANSFLTSDPILSTHNSRAYIDIDDDGLTLIVGTPDSGTALDSTFTFEEGGVNHVDEAIEGKATGEWNVYKWTSIPPGDRTPTSEDYDYSMFAWVQRGDTGTVDVDSSGGQEIGMMVSISSDGDTVVVSTNTESAQTDKTVADFIGHSNRGFVYVYKWTDTDDDDIKDTWVQRGSSISDIQSETEKKFSGYPRYFSVDANVDYIAISTYRYDPDNTQHADGSGRDNYGAVRVFKYDESTSDWVQFGNIISPVLRGDYNENTYFGNAVCLSKDTSLGDNENPIKYPRLAVMDINSVYVYDYETVSESFTVLRADTNTELDVLRNELTIVGHLFQNGDMVRYNVETDADGYPPSANANFENLTNGVSYEVVNVDGDTFQLSDGSVIAFTLALGGLQPESDENNRNVHTFATETWVQKGDAILRDNAFIGDGPIADSPDFNHSEHNSYPPAVTDGIWDMTTSSPNDSAGNNKSPSIAFSEDKKTIIIGDHTPLEGNQRGLLRELNLAGDDWSSRSMHRSLVGTIPHSHFGTDALITRKEKILVSDECGVNRFTAAILVCSEPLIEEYDGPGETTGQVHIYIAPITTPIPPPTTNPTVIISTPLISNNGNTTATEHRFTFELSEAAGDGTSFEETDIKVTKGTLTGFTAMLDTGTQLTHFEATLTVNNSDEDGQVIIEIEAGSFRNVAQEDNKSATFIMNYSFLPPPTLCSSCPSVLTEDHKFKYMAVAISEKDGWVLTFPIIQYYLQYQDNPDDPFKSLCTSANCFLVEAKSGDEQSLDVLLKELKVGCLSCHSYILGDGDTSSCQDYDEYNEPHNCVKRVFKRKFRIMATSDLLTSVFSNSFQLYQYFLGQDVGEPDGDGSFSAGDWVREFTTTSDGGDDVNNFPDQSQAIGIPGEKQIISRFDMRRTNDTSGPYAFNYAMTPFELCPAIVDQCLTGDTDNWFAFQRLLVSSKFYPSDGKGSIQHYVFNSYQPHPSEGKARDWLKNGNDWFFEDYPFVITNLNSAHTGTSNDQHLGHAIAPIRSKIPKPYGGTPPTTMSVVPIGYWFMKNLTELEFIEAYGGRDTSIGGGDILECSRGHNYGSLHNLWAVTPHVECERHAGVTIDLDARGISRAQIATDGDGDTVVVSAPYGQATVPVTVLRTYGGTETQNQSVHEIFSTATLSRHWKPNSLCLNDAGNVLGYTYRDSNTTQDTGNVAIYELLGATYFSQKPPPAKVHQKWKRRNVVGLTRLLGPTSNLSVLKMDKSGNNIIVSCTRGKVLTDNHAETTGWAQVFTYHSPSNQYRAKGQRLEGTVMNGQFGIDCDISSDGQSVVVSSCEANINGITQYGSTNRHGAIRCYAWNGSDWEQLGKTIRGTNYWSNLGFHLSYEADYIRRIAAFEGTDQGNPLLGDISMYRFEGR